MAQSGRRTRVIPERFMTQIARSPLADYVYLARDDTTECIKVGVTYGPRVPDRMWEITQAAGSSVTLLALIEGDAKLERSYHRLLAADRLHGEWFAPSVAVLNFVSHHAHWGGWEGF